MNVSRSGYYKWLNRKGIINNYQKNRISLAEEIKNIHKDGYLVIIYAIKYVKV